MGVVGGDARDRNRDVAGDSQPKANFEADFVRRSTHCSDSLRDQLCDARILRAPVDPCFAPPRAPFSMRVWTTCAAGFRARLRPGSPHVSGV